MTAQEIQEQIQQIDEIIKQLIAAAASGAPTAQVRRYRIDSGQSVVETERYTASSIPGAIAQWRRQRQELINSLDGRVNRLLPSLRGA